MFNAAVGRDDFVSKLLVFMWVMVACVTDSVEQLRSNNSFGVLNNQAQAQAPIQLAFGSVHASDFFSMEPLLP